MKVGLYVNNVNYNALYLLINNVNQIKNLNVTIFADSLLL